jgi:NADH-quinone oxidoreductase subunit C
VSAVAPAAWAQELAALHGRGFRYLDLLTGVDRLDHVEVLAQVVDLDTLERSIVSTLVPDGAPHLASIVPVYPAAAWHERETAEMFGIRFEGHPDPRPLLLRTLPALPPLRKASALRARVETPWPGAVTPEEGKRPRRAQLPPGVRESWMPEVGA